ncbi:hypothetical protein N7463_002478 [Penicillium fimorum]|uniref:Uncharacterized protein n=1 Tax=Penicillium fimorum TaxID=1882269 RepID=A0A9W9XZ64_9EURO|nr:hypothetical protein N7463_002478 [Penicillium fimorum]
MAAQRVVLHDFTCTSNIGFSPLVYRIPLVLNYKNIHLLPVAQLLTSTYLAPPIPLTSKLGREIGTKARSMLGTAIYPLVMPREFHILSSRLGGGGGIVGARAKRSLDFYLVGINSVWALLAS